MDAFLFRRLRDSLDDPQKYQGKGRYVLLRKEKATIPVILSAPHGGGDKSFPVATHSMKPRLPGGKNVSMKSDLYTLQVIASVDKYIFDLCGQHCYVVAATVHRRFVDANRNAKDVEDNAHNPECSESGAYYNEYHASLDSCIADCRLRHPAAPHVLLLDIHGQAVYEDMVVLGTRNRKTCSLSSCSGSYSDLSAGSYDVDIPFQGFIWHLQSMLGRTSLPLPGQEDISPYRGGHIVGTYGSQWALHRQQEVNGEEKEEGTNLETARQVSAVQLEFGSALRSDSVLRAEVAKCTATAVVRSLWPASCLTVHTRNNPHDVAMPLVPTSCDCGCACHCPLACISSSLDSCKCSLVFSKLDGVLGSTLGLGALLSTQPFGKCFEPHKTRLEHDFLRSLIHPLLLERATLHHLHPWFRGISSSAETLDEVDAQNTFVHGCGERGRALIRRIFIPRDRTTSKDRPASLEETNVRGEEAGEVALHVQGTIEGLVYVSDSGVDVVACDDMENADPGRLVIGRLLTYSSNGEVSMAQLEHEAAVQSSAQQCGLDGQHSLSPLLLKSGGDYGVIGGCGWRVAHVTVAKADIKFRHYLAFVYVVI